VIPKKKDSKFMTNLEMLKESMGDQLDQLPQFVHFSWCITQLGKGYTVPVDMVDDLYTALVSGQTGDVIDPDKLNAFGGFFPTEEEKFSDIAYMKFFHCLVEMGTKIFPFDAWIENNQESEAWADYVADGSEAVVSFEEDRETWIKDFKEKMSLNKK